MKKSIDAISPAIAQKLIDFRGYDFAVSLTYAKVIKCNAKDRQTKAPFNGEIVAVQKYANVGFGADYGNAVRNRLKKAGSNVEFTADALPYGEWIEGSKTAIMSKTNGAQIRFYRQANTKVSVQYYLNGKLTLKENLPDVMPLERKQSSAKQEAQGLPQEAQAKPFNLILSQIEAVNGTKF